MTPITERISPEELVAILRCHGTDVHQWKHDLRGTPRSLAVEMIEHLNTQLQIAQIELGHKDFEIKEYDRLMSAFRENLSGAMTGLSK